MQCIEKAVGSSWCSLPFIFSQIIWRNRNGKLHVICTGVSDSKRINIRRYYFAGKRGIDIEILPFPAFFTEVILPG